MDIKACSPHNSTGEHFRLFSRMYSPESCRQPRTGGENFNVLSGPCTSTGRCITSPNFPNNYGNSEFCEVVAPHQPLYFTSFETEDGRDFLTIDGQAFSGSSGPPQGSTSSGMILWNSSADTTASGWQMCTAHGLKLGCVGLKNALEFPVGGAFFGGICAMGVARNVS